MTASRTERPTARTAAAGRSTAVLREDEEHPAGLGEVPGRMREGIATWLRSPALDFYALVVVGGLLLGTGLVMVLSSSAVMSLAKGLNPYTGLFRQGRFALIGAPLLLLAAAAPPRIYRRFATLLLGLGFLLQLLVFVPGLGFEVLGNRNWIRIGSMQLQPSELLKLALAVWLGATLASKYRELTQPRALLWPVAPVAGLAIGLVVLGHDLGTAMIMCMLVAGALWVAGVPRRWFAGVAVLGLLGVAVMTLTSPNRMARISNWLHGQCEGSSCWQSQHGLMALAEGGWTGVGLGESRQKWGLLPAADNDFIFAIIGEELGLWGTLGVLALFAVLALIMFRMITRAQNLFIQITTAGISLWLLGQAFTNMMVVTGLLPVLGVPLPFISAGGSALVSSMLALGMLLSFARHEPGAADAIRASIRRVRRGAAVMPAAASPRRGTGSRRATTPRSRRTQASSGQSSSGQTSSGQSSRTQRSRTQSSRTQASRSQPSRRRR